MKKWISLVLALSLLLSAAVIPAMAEESAGSTDAVTSASVMKGGRNGRNAAPGRQMPSGQHGRNRTPSDTAAPQAEPPAAPELPVAPELPAEPELPVAPEQPAESNAPESSESAPAASSGKQVKKSSGNTARTVKKGKASVSAGSLTVTLDLLLEKGVISQDVYQAILAFIQSNSLLEAASPDDSNG